MLAQIIRRNTGCAMIFEDRIIRGYKYRGKVNIGTSSPHLRMTQNISSYFRPSRGNRFGPRGNQFAL